MSTKREVVLCWDCNGTGEREIPGELYDYHKGLYHDSATETCSTCDGLGRLVVTTTVTVSTLSQASGPPHN
jgi:DnaJ-class molecular chaperone